MCSPRENRAREGRGQGVGRRRRPPPAVAYWPATSHSPPSPKVAPPQARMLCGPPAGPGRERMNLKSKVCLLKHCGTSGPVRFGSSWPRNVSGHPSAAGPARAAPDTLRKARTWLLGQLHFSNSASVLIQACFPDLGLKRSVCRRRGGGGISLSLPPSLSFSDSVL